MRKDIKVLGAVHPQEDFDSKPFWDWLRAKDLRLQYCDKCSKYRFPPYPSCPHCGKVGGIWKPVSGRGSIYSWIVVHSSPLREYQEEAPYVIALVQLEEGPRIVGRLVGVDPEGVQADLPVVAQYVETEENLTLIAFKPEMN